MVKGHSKAARKTLEQGNMALSLFDNTINAFREQIARYLILKNKSWME